MDRFEYKIQVIDDGPYNTTREAIREELNILGEVGWEVVHVYDGITYLLKRKK